MYFCDIWRTEYLNKCDSLSQADPSLEYFTLGSPLGMLEKMKWKK